MAATVHDQARSVKLVAVLVAILGVSAAAAAGTSSDAQAGLRRQPSEDALWRSFELAQHRGDVDLAVDIYAELQSFDPDPAETWGSLAEACMAGAECSRHGEEVLRQAERLLSQRSDLAAALARRLARRGAVDDAVALLGGKLARAPLDQDLWDAWLQTVWQRRPRTRIAEALVAHADRHAGNAEVRARVLEELWRFGDPGMLDTELRRALIDFPCSPDIWALSGERALEQDRRAVAGQALRQAERCLPQQAEPNERMTALGRSLAEAAEQARAEARAERQRETDWLFVEHDLEPNDDY